VELCTRRWIKEFVIERNLCPFARREWERDTIRYRLYLGCSSDDLLAVIDEECSLLDVNAYTETTMIIVPNMLQDFLDFNDFDYFDWNLNHFLDDLEDNFFDRLLHNLLNDDRDLYNFLNFFNLNDWLLHLDDFLNNFFNFNVFNDFDRLLDNFFNLLDYDGFDRFFNNLLNNLDSLDLNLDRLFDDHDLLCYYRLLYDLVDIFDLDHWFFHDSLNVSSNDLCCEFALSSNSIRLQFNL